MRIVSIISLILLYAYASVDYLRIFQLDGYKIIIKKSTLKKLLHYVYMMLPTSAFNITSYCTNINPMYSYIFQVAFVLIYLLCKKCFERQKIKFTKRVVRLLTTILILLSILVSVVWIWNLYFVSIIILIIPLIIFISNFINKPIENVVKNHYIKKAKEIMQTKDILVIGITGSFGKTTVKNILTQLLSLKYKVIATPKNFNTEMGVCLSINNIKDEEIFIVEMGARNRFDIKKITDICKPNIGIITGVGKQHLDTFKSISNVYNTKRELQENVVDNVMFYNDSNTYAKMLKKSFLGEGFGIESTNYKIEEFDGYYQHFSFDINNTHYSAKTKLIGDHNIQNIILAIVCANYLNVDVGKMISKIEEINYVDNRCELIKTENNVTIINDSYNANFEGCISSLNFLKKLNGKKIVFTQGIVELNDEQYSTNYRLGENIAKVANIVILLGVNLKAIKNGLIDSGFDMKNVIELKHFSEVKKVFEKIIKQGDIVMIQNDLTDNY